MSQEAWNQVKASSPVRIQWDPERDLFLRPLDHRAIQIGLSGRAVELYVSQWIRKITDVTDLAHKVHALVLGGELDEACAELPKERPYITHVESVFR